MCTFYYARKINNVEVDNAEDLYIVMLTYNLLGYNENYAKKSAGLWQYYRDEPIDSKLFKVKSSITNNTSNNGIREVKVCCAIKVFK